MKQYPLFKVFMSDEAVENASKVLRSGYVGQGTKVEEFESALKAYTNSDRDIITLNSATTAIDLSLHMIGIRPDDEIISTPITCTATNSPPINRGAMLVWAEVDRNTGLINPDDVKRKITDKTKAIIGVNWGGRKPDYNKLKSYGIPVIEDSAHGPYVLDGNNGDYIIWSTQAIKFLTTGDGGFLYCPDPERARLLRWYGLDRRSSNDFRCAQNIQEVGYKYHMNDIAAAIGLGNLSYLNDIVDKHKNNAALYEQLLTIDKPIYDPNCPYWIYTVFGGKELIDYLKQFGIAASPVHARNDTHYAFRKQSKFCDNSSVVEYDRRQVNIPVGWWLSEEDIEYIAHCVNTF